MPRLRASRLAADDQIPVPDVWKEGDMEQHGLGAQHCAGCSVPRICPGLPAPTLPVCRDCLPSGSGYVPCIRHGGGEHGFDPGPHFMGWDDSWEHWKRRALFAEAHASPVPVSREAILVILGRTWTTDQYGSWADIPRDVQESMADAILRLLYPTL